MNEKPKKYLIWITPNDIRICRGDAGFVCKKWEVPTPSIGIEIFREYAHKLLEAVAEVEALNALAEVRAEALKREEDILLGADDTQKGLTEAAITMGAKNANFEI